jgi:hypothetical protein
MRLYDSSFHSRHGFNDVETSSVLLASLVNYALFTNLGGSAELKTPFLMPSDAADSEYHLKNSYVCFRTFVGIYP